MHTKYLILLALLMSIAFQAWSQTDFQVVFDEEPVSRKQDTIIVTDTCRIKIVEKAREFIGVGYHYGQSNASGFDCSGYVKFVYGNFGFDLPHSSLEQYKKSKHIKAPEAKPGDLVFFITRGTGISHVGIYLGDNLFIHSPSRGKSVSIDSLDAAYYKKHLAGFGKVL